MQRMNESTTSSSLSTLWVQVNIVIVAIVFVKKPKPSNNICVVHIEFFVFVDRCRLIVFAHYKTR